MGLNIQNLVKTFGSVKALDDISFHVDSGAFVCFLGPSGCGKTTLLRAIAGLEPVDSGSIVLDDSNMSGIPARQRNFGVVFQSYSLFPNMTARRNVGYGLECRGEKKDRITERANEMLELVGLGSQADKLPAQMSGGQQQRVALARALAPDPSLLLLDEPLSALDAKVRETLRHEIRTVQQRLGITTIMVTHDQEEALAMADVILVLNEGRVEQIGSPRELYAAPKTAFVADFIGRMNVLPLDTDSGTPAFGGIELSVEDGHCQPGDRLGIRPEAIGLYRREEVDGRPNVIHGEVSDIVFLGNISRVEIVPEHRRETPLTVELHGSDPLPSVGDRLALHLPADALRVLS